MDGHKELADRNRFWFDTEFIEDGKTIDLISIGIVSEDGREYYAEVEECDLSRAAPWVQENVIVHLTGERKPRAQIAAEIVTFVGEKPEFWAYYADYDWVALCQLYGRMIDLPKGWPMFCRDVKQLAVSVGDPKLPKQTTIEHHALADARDTKAKWHFVSSALDASYRRGLDDAAALPQAAIDVIAERRRQVSGEGWTPEHDDQHVGGEMARAAACYAISDYSFLRIEAGGNETIFSRLWPWEWSWWKPKNRRRNLVRAGALILAEIERIDRAAIICPAPPASTKD